MMGRALEHDKKIDVLTWRIDKLEGDLKILAIALITSDTYIPKPEPVEEEVEYEEEDWEEEDVEEDAMVYLKKKYSFISFLFKIHDYWIFLIKNMPQNHYFTPHFHLKSIISIIKIHIFL